MENRLIISILFIFLVSELHKTWGGDEFVSRIDMYEVSKGENNTHQQEIIAENSVKKKRESYFYPSVQPPFQQYETYGQPFANQPFCFDRWIVGNCKYRMERYDCENYKWTAYATIQNTFVGIQQLRSIPDGLEIPPDFYPGTRARLRLRLTTSCCMPTVQFLSINPDYPNSGLACIVDVRELQSLHPGEIVAVAAGIFIILIIILTTTCLCIRRNSNNRKSRRRRNSVIESPID